MPMFNGPMLLSAKPSEQIEYNMTIKADITIFLIFDVPPKTPIAIAYQKIPDKSRDLQYIRVSLFDSECL